MATNSKLWDLFAHLYWKLTHQTKTRPQILGHVFGSYRSKPHTTSCSLAGNEPAGLLLFPEQDLSSFPAGTLALTRLSYPFSLLSTPKERWNSPQLMNNLQARETGKCKDPTQVLVKGKQWESKVRNTHLISSNLTASLKFLKHRLLGVEQKMLRWFTQKLNHHGRVLSLQSQIKSTDCQNTEKSRDEVLYLHANE